jgi:hypothetical protein
VEKVQAGDGGDLQAADLDPAVAAVAGVVSDRDVAPGQDLELLVQRMSAYTFTCRLAYGLTCRSAEASAPVRLS